MKAHKFVEDFGIEKAKEVLEVRAMDNFEEWFQSQDFYTNLRFIHGDALFLKDGDVYRVLEVRIASDAWQEQQKRIDELCVGIRKLIEEYKSEEKELELKEWEQSTIYGRIAIELEQALKGGEA